MVQFGAAGKQILILMQIGLCGIVLNFNSLYHVSLWPLLHQVVEEAQRYGQSKILTTVQYGQEIRKLHPLTQIGHLGLNFERKSCRLDTLLSFD